MRSSLFNESVPGKWRRKIIKDYEGLLAVMVFCFPLIVSMNLFDVDESIQKKKIDSSMVDAYLF